MSRVMSRGSQRKDQGAVAVIVAVFMVVAMILMAFIVDRGMIYVARNQLQDVVDSAALAAAHELCVFPTSTSRVTSQAVMLAQSNGVSAPLVDTDGRTYVNVRANRVVPMAFGSFLGNSRVAVAAQATSGAMCGGLFSVFGEGPVKFNGTGTNGYTVYFGTDFTYQSSGGATSTFDAIYFPSTATPPNSNVIGPRIVAPKLTTTQYYSLLQAANPTVLPAPTSTSATASFDFSDAKPCITQGGTPGLYANSAQLKAALQTPILVRCIGSLSGSDALTYAGVQANILVTGNITISGTSPTMTPTSRLIYSRDGDISVQQVNSENTVYFAENGGVVVGESASKPTTVCSVISKTLATWNGGRQYVGCLSPVLLPGIDATTNYLIQ